MNQEDMLYYDNLQAVFQTEGWASIIEKAKSQEVFLVEALVGGEVDIPNDRLRGRIDVYRELVSLEESIEATLETIEEDDNADV